MGPKITTARADLQPIGRAVCADKALQEWDWVVSEEKSALELTINHIERVINLR
jgi:hypothetical protein